MMKDFVKLVNPLSSHKPSAQEKLRLVFFPWAGGNSTLFLPLAEEIYKTTSGIHCYCLEMPGKGSRFREPLIHDFRQAVLDVLEGLQTLERTEQFMSSVPIIFLGVSLGALFAYGIMSEIVKVGMHLPKHFIVCASRNPQDVVLDPSQYSKLSDDQLLAHIKKNGGNVALLEDPRMREVFLPILRADYSLLDSFNMENAAKLNVPFYVLGGSKDPGVSQASLAGWGSFTNASFKLEDVEGGHFFIQEKKAEIAKKIGEVAGFYLN